MKKKDNKSFVGTAEDLTVEILNNIVENPEMEYCAVGGYHLIVNILTGLIKADDFSLYYINICDPEIDDYDNAYIIEICDRYLYVGRLLDEETNRYLTIEDDVVYVEEEYYNAYTSANKDGNVIVFKYETKDSKEDNLNTCMCMDDDYKGFTFCINDDGYSNKFKYRTNNKLTEKEVWDIIHKQFSD